MSVIFEEVKEQSRKLLPREKAALARILIEDLDATSDPDVEELWIAEAQRRYEGFQRGEIEASPADEVLSRVRDRLK